MALPAGIPNANQFKVWVRGPRHDRGMSSGRPTSIMTAMHWRTGLRYLPALTILPALLAVGLWLVPLQADQWSYHLQFALACATLALSAWLVLHSSYPRPLILALTISLGLWTLGVACLLVQIDLFDSRVATTNYSHLLFVSHGIPLLYIAVTFGAPYSDRRQKLLDGLLMGLLGLLYWINIEDLLSVRGSTSPAAQWYVRHALDAESAILAVVHTARWLTASSGETRRFFRITSVFLVSYCLCIGVHNHFDMEVVGVNFWSRMGDILPPVPFLALGLMLYHWRKAPAEDATSDGLAHQVTQRVVLSVSPILFLAAIFAVGLSVKVRHTGLVLTVVGLAVAAYVLRMVHTQYRYLQDQDRLQGMAQALERLSYTDAVTDLPNRRAFDNALVREWAASTRTPGGMSVLMIDVDKFKQYNDSYGHNAGDHCLRAVARLVAGSLHRPADFCGRFGGEEFVILLPATPLEGAEVVARRILGHIHAANLPHADGIDGRVSVSIGVAARCVADAHGEALVERADRNLYRAKDRGRNRCDASDTGPGPVRLRLVQG